MKEAKENKMKSTTSSKMIAQIYQAKEELKGITGFDARMNKEYKIDTEDVYAGLQLGRSSNSFQSFIVTNTLYEIGRFGTEGKWAKVWENLNKEKGFRIRMEKSSGNYANFFITFSDQFIF